MIHTDDIPMHPVTNNINSPAYEVAQFLWKVLKNENLNLPKELITSNSMTLANTLTYLNVKDEYKQELWTHECHHALTPPSPQKSTNSLVNFDIQLFQQCNTIINEQSQKDINSLFDLIYDIKVNHACKWFSSTPLSSISVQTHLRNKYHQHSFTWHVLLWQPFHLHMFVCFLDITTLLVVFFTAL
jgi:hypothetical protein